MFNWSYMNKVEVEVIDTSFDLNNYRVPTYMDQWPVVYILHGKKEIYIGETNDHTARITSHNHLKKDYGFKSVKIIFISKSAGDPNKDKKVIGIPYIGKPMTACTDSLIPIGNFDNLVEAENLQKYLKTKFVRYLISILKTSQNVYQNVYSFVPIQNFKNSSDINWAVKIEHIDTQLYEKYSLENYQIEHIEKSINYM